MFLLSVLDTIAFHSVLTSYSTIPDGSTVIFNEVLLNEGDGYVLLLYFKDPHDTFTFIPS